MTKLIPNGVRPNVMSRHLDIVGADALAELVTMSDAIGIVAQAMMDISGHSIDAPPRWTTPVSSDGRMALMPGINRGCERFGLKVLSLFDQGTRQGLPGHQGLMLLFDGVTGRPLTVIEASALTGLRTAAASALATRLLAPQEARSMAILGCGEQARRHAEAIPLVRPIDKAWIWGRSVESAEAFAATHLAHVAEVIVARSVEEAVRDADIITTATHAADPILRGDWLRPGQHLNLVGSSTVASREVDDLTVKRACLVVDSRENALSQGGELVHAISSGAVTPSHIHAELGEVLLGSRPGRPSGEAITIYKSLGHAAQDLVVAQAVNERLAAQGWRDRVPW